MCDYMYVCDLHGMDSAKSSNASACWYEVLIEKGVCLLVPGEGKGGGEGSILRMLYSLVVASFECECNPCTLSTYSSSKIAPPPLD